MERTYRGHTITPYPNQKVVFVDKAACDKKNPYTLINQKALQKAIRKLCVGYKTPAPFAMWCYLARYKPDTPLYMSNVLFESYTGLSKKSYDHAIKVLIESGYLRKADDCIWIFDENGI